MTTHSQVRITKPSPGMTCHKEIRLDPAGKPVYCPSKAVMVINGTPLCQKHADEMMVAIVAKTK